MKQFKQFFKSIAVLCFCLIVTTPTEAQRNYDAVLDIKKIASMLIEEKASKKIDNAPFIAYLGSLGFEKENSYTYKKEIIGNDNPLIVRITIDGDSRLFKLYNMDNGVCWYYFIRLKEFGLRGPNATAKGKGLMAMAGKDYLWVGYKLPKKAK